MIHLVVIACLVAAPHTCQEMAVPDVSSEDVATCMHDGLTNADKWQGANPD
jgi:hypothetical protein